MRKLPIIFIQVCLLACCAVSCHYDGASPNAVSDLIKEKGLNAINEDIPMGLAAQNSYLDIFLQRPPGYGASVILYAYSSDGLTPTTGLLGKFSTPKVLLALDRLDSYCRTRYKNDPSFWNDMHPTRNEEEYLKWLSDVRNQIAANIVFWDELSSLINDKRNTVVIKKMKNGTRDVSGIAPANDEWLSFINSIVEEKDLGNYWMEHEPGYAISINGDNVYYLQHVGKNLYIAHVREQEAPTRYRIINSFCIHSTPEISMQWNKLQESFTAP